MPNTYISPRLATGKDFYKQKQPTKNWLNTGTHRHASVKDAVAKKNAERHKTLRDKSTLQNSKYQSSMISLFQTEYALSEVLLLLCLTIDMDLQSNSH